MIYALKSDVSDYTGIAESDLPDDIDRLLARVEELIENTVRSNGQPEIASIETDANDSQKELEVLDISNKYIAENDEITILDNDNSETATIVDIDTDAKGNDIITLQSELTNSYSVADRAYIKTNNPDDFHLKQRRALKKATSAQIEYWLTMSEDIDVTPMPGDFSIGSFSMGTANESGKMLKLAPRARRLLLNAGLLYTGRPSI